MMKNILLITFLLAFGVCAQSQELSKFGVANSEAPQGLAIGEKLPTETGINNSNNPVTLKSLQSNGPLIVVFFRGSWCPYCNKHLSVIADSIDLIKAKGATVVAITPEKKKAYDYNSSELIFLQDKDNKLMQAFDVAFDVTQAYQEKLKVKKQLNLATNNEQEQAVLPIPATFIFNNQGELVSRHVDVNYANRSSVKWMLEQLP